MAVVATVEGVDRLFSTAAQYLPENDVETVRRAFEFASEAHGEQQRVSGDPYVTHPVAVAQVLADLRLDAASLSAALLHDVVEDTAIGLDEVEPVLAGRSPALWTASPS